MERVTLSGQALLKPLRLLSRALLKALRLLSRAHVIKCLVVLCVLLCLFAYNSGYSWTQVSQVKKIEKIEKIENWCESLQKILRPATPSTENVTTLKVIGISFHHCHDLLDDCFLINSTHLTSQETFHAVERRVIPVPSNGTVKKSIQQAADYEVILRYNFMQHCAVAPTKAFLFLEDDFQFCLHRQTFLATILSNAHACKNRVCTFTYGFGAVLFTCNMLEVYLRALQEYTNEPVDMVLYRLPVTQFQPYIFEHIRLPRGEKNDDDARLHGGDITAACFSSCRDIANVFCNADLHVLPLVAAGVPSIGQCTEYACQIPIGCKERGDYFRYASLKMNNLRRFAVVPNCEMNI